MGSDRSPGCPARDEFAGVPSAAFCEERAAEARRAAEATKLGNVRDQYRRSAERWSELAHEKVNLAETTAEPH